MRLRGIAFVFLFFAMLCYPLWGRYIGRNVTLSGVTLTTDQPELSWSGIWTGEYQSQSNTHYEETFEGRNLLIKLRSQLLYSVFNESPNENVVIGKDQYLYDPAYILQELSAEDHVATDEYFADLKSRLLAFQQLLSEKGKELYIFVTPNKAYYEKEEIPWNYRMLETDEVNNITRLRAMLETTDLHYLIARDYIDAERETMDVPVFYSTGIHWSRPWGARSAMALYDVMRQNSRFELSDIALETYPYSGEIEWPDADLYQSLNLFEEPDESYYSARIHVTREGEKPNVFCRGGSFLGQSWSMLVQSGCFSNDLHYENNYFFTNQYTTQTTLSVMAAYEESDEWIPFLRDADIVVLEINEASIEDATFGFVDYVLDHSEILN